MSDHDPPASEEASDRCAATEVVTTLRPSLLAFFQRRCSNSAEAEDLTQDVIVRALKKGNWASDDDARRYIFTIAINRWLDRQRQSRTQGAIVPWQDEDLHRLVEETRPEDVLSTRETLHEVVQCLSRMEERTRDMFVLFRLANLRQSEIAEMFGVSVSAVEKQIAKALARLLVEVRTNRGPQ